MSYYLYGRGTLQGYLTLKYYQGDISEREYLLYSAGIWMDAPTAYGTGWLMTRPMAIAIWAPVVAGGVVSYAGWGKEGLDDYLDYLDDFDPLDPNPKGAAQKAWKGIKTFYDEVYVPSVHQPLSVDDLPNPHHVGIEAMLLAKKVYDVRRKHIRGAWSPVSL